MSFELSSGVLLVDKPLGLSSFSVLKRLKAIFPISKLGHTGALDPLASGMLPVCIGEATKYSSYLLDADKSYYVCIQLGSQTGSYDLDGEFTQFFEKKILNIKDVEDALAYLQGEIYQEAPLYSALKYKGKPLYYYQRRGIDVPTKKRTVCIHSLKLCHFDITSQQVFLHVRCSKGTYIRSLAYDLGCLLQTGAHISMLRRLSVAPFFKQNMYGLDELKCLSFDSFLDLLHPCDIFLKGYDVLDLSLDAFVALYQGKKQTMFYRDGLYRLYFEGYFLGLGHLESNVLCAKRLLSLQSLGLEDKFFSSF